LRPEDIVKDEADRTNPIHIETHAFNAFAADNSIGWVCHDLDNGLALFLDDNLAVPQSMANHVRKHGVLRAGFQQALRLLGSPIDARYWTTYRAF